MRGRTSLAAARVLMKGRMLMSSLSDMSSYQDTMGTPLLTWYPKTCTAHIICQCHQNLLSLR